MSEEERKKCVKCKVNLLLKDYKLKRDGLYSKNCKNCLIVYSKSNKINREKHKVECTICKQIMCKNNIDKHIKAVHNKIKDLECKYEGCEFKCSANSDLKVHINSVHLKEFHFFCEYENCEFKSYAKKTLKSHIKRYHDRIKDYICEYEKCDMKFSTNGGLQRHIKRVHLKIKDFECEQCDYKCSSKDSLTKHIKTCTGKEHISSGEYKVRECLREMNIVFQHNTSHIVKDIQLLHWDFILYKNDKVQVFIEYDGEQHFKPIYFGTKSKIKANKKFNDTLRRDKIKDDFCKENNYPLLRIPYTKFGNIPELVTTFCVEHLDWGNEL